LVAVLVAAAAFRLLYLLQFDAVSIFARAPMLDAAVYDAWARAIAGGALLPAAPFYFAPGYAYALAGLYALAGPSMTGAFLVQFALGLVNLALVHRLAARAFGPRAALWALCLAALYAPLPFLEAKLLSSTLGLTLQLLLLELLLAAAAAPHPRRWAAAGLSGGLASLVRPETLLLAPLALAWIWRQARSRPATGAAGAVAPLLSGRRALAAGALVAAGWALAVAPVALHNLASGGGATLISSQAGITFYHGNNARARGLYTVPPEEGLSGDPALQEREERAIAERRLGRPLSNAEVSSYWLGRGLAFVRDEPGRFLWLLGMKLLRYVGSYEYSTEYVLAVERERVWLLWLPFVPFGLLVALAVPALAAGLLAPRRAAAAGLTLNPAGRLLLVALAANVATCLLFYVSVRYRLAAVPVLAVLGGATAALLERRLRAGARRTAAPVVAAVAAVFLAVHFPVDASARIQEGSVHYNAGYLWVTRGQHGRAVEELRRAVALDPSRFESWFNLGSSLAELGRHAEAAEAYGAAAARQPRVFDAHAQQGFSLVACGDLSGAREALRKAVALRPDVYEVQLALGQVEARLGDREAALGHLDRALALRPGAPEALAARRRAEGFSAF